VTTSFLGAKMLGAYEKSSGETRSVCTAWRRNTFPLSGRRRRCRHSRRSDELLVVRHRNGPLPTGGYFI